MKQARVKKRSAHFFLSIHLDYNGVFRRVLPVEDSRRIEDRFEILLDDVTAHRFAFTAYYAIRIDVMICKEQEIQTDVAI